jgi:ribosomal protein S18 acetylase RimI-like enzyme
MKIGQKLFEKAIEIAHEHHYRFIWLGVWEKNEKAIGFYIRNGFTVFDRHLFTLGDDVQTDLMMRRDL